MRLAEANRQIKELELKLDVLYDHRAKALSRITVECTNNIHGEGCGKRTQIGKLEYIQLWYYVPPRGCTEGDYHVPSDGEFICIKCGHKNRLWNRPKIMELKRYFKSIVEEKV
jgi:hypothetical protein